MLKSRLNLSAWIQPLLAVVIGLLGGAIAIALIGGSVVDTYAQMWKGAFGSFYFNEYLNTRYATHSCWVRCIDRLPCRILQHGVRRSNDPRRFIQRDGRPLSPWASSI